MAVTYVRETSYNATAPSTPFDITLSGTPAAGNSLVLSFLSLTGWQLTGVSGCGATWTQPVVRKASGGANLMMYVGRGCNGSGSTVTLTTQSADAQMVNVAEYAGVSTSATLSGAGASTFGTSLNPGALTVVSVGDLVCFALAASAPGATAPTPTDVPSGGYTDLTATVNGSNRALRPSHRISTATGSHSRDYGFGGSSFFMAAIGLLLPAAPSTAYTGWGAAL